MEKEVSDFIQDSSQQKRKYNPMGKIERSILWVLCPVSKHMQCCHILIGTLLLPFITDMMSQKWLVWPHFLLGRMRRAAMSCSSRRSEHLPIQVWRILFIYQFIILPCEQDRVWRLSVSCCGRSSLHQMRSWTPTVKGSSGIPSWPSNAGDSR